MKKNYLVLPVNDAHPAKQIVLRKGEQLLSDWKAAYDPEHPAFDAYLDITRFGKGPFSLQCADGTEIPLRFAERMPDKEEIPGFEVLRPAVHFTTKLGWINDPNGLVYADGRYHMFYQHNPAGWHWGNMTWGHAVSSDLVHWEEWGDALFPDETGTMYSGSAVCDAENAAGFGKNAILLFYTAAGGTSALSETAPFTQGLAYSVDQGKTFRKYDKNPVLPHIIGSNRDPKVQWAEELHAFTLSLFLDGHTYAVFVSDNLKVWDKLCEIDLPEDAECPDFYPLTASDGARKWIFTGAGDSYLVGDLKNGTFLPCQEALRYQVRPGVSYAAQTFSGTPGRRIKIAWDRVSAPGALFNSQMSVPMEMRLEKVGGQYRLASLPVKELSELYTSSVTGEFHSTGALRIRAVQHAADVTVDLLPGCGPFTLSCFGMELFIDPVSGYYRHGNCTAPLASGSRTLRILFDTLSMEVFAEDGRIYSTMGGIADRTRPLQIVSDAPTALRLTVHEMHADRR